MSRSDTRAISKRDTPLLGLGWSGRAAGGGGQVGIHVPDEPDVVGDLQTVLVAYLMASRLQGQISMRLFVDGLRMKKWRLYEPRGEWQETNNADEIQEVLLYLLRGLTLLVSLELEEEQG